MKMEFAISSLSARGITVSAERITQAIAPVSIESLAETDIDFVAEAVSEGSVALAPTTTPQSAITRKGSSKLTKAQLQEQLAAAEAKLAAATIPVQPVQMAMPSSNQVQEMVLGSIQAYVSQGEAAIAQGSQVLAEYRAVAGVRFWRAVDVAQQQVGIQDPTEAILAQQRQQNNNMLANIKDLINQSNEALGINGMGFDVEVMS